MPASTVLASLMSPFVARRLRASRRATAGFLLRIAGVVAVSCAVPCGTAHAVDANTATLAQLDALSGVGPKIAQRILDERRSRPFRDLADFEQRVRGIGPATAKKLAAAGLSVGAAGPVAGMVTGAGAGAGAGAMGAHASVIEVPPPTPVPSQRQRPSQARRAP